MFLVGGSLLIERCIERALKKLLSLRSYFLSENSADTRFVGLRNAFCNQSWSQFCSSTVQIFTQFNKLPQRSEPTSTFCEVQ